MERWKAGRRSFLGALGGGALGYGLLGSPILRSQDSTKPKRLVVMFTPDGTVHDDWRPKGSQRDFTLGNILQPFEQLKDELLVLDGVDLRTPGAHGDAHTQGMTSILTARGAGGGGNQWSSGPSIDEFVNLRIGEGRPVLRLGVATGGSNPWSRMTYDERGFPLGVEDNPLRVRDTIFRGFDPSGVGPTQEQLRDAAIRERALLYAKRRALDLSRRGSVSAKLDLEGHANSLQRLIDEPGQQGEGACSLDLIDRVNAWDDDLSFPGRTKKHMELISAAFACDLSRVAVLQLSKSNSEEYYDWIGVNKEHHGLSHYEFGYADPHRTQDLSKISRWHAQQMAWLVDDLKKNGLLDNTVVFWTSELAHGLHSHESIPMVIAGSGGGHFSTGQYVDHRGQGGVAHGDVLTSIVNAMGIEADSYGSISSGPLTGIL